MAFTLGDAVLYLNTNTAGLNKGLGDAERLTKQRFGNIQRLANSVGKKTAIAGAAILGGLIGSVKEWADAGDQVQKMSLRTGFAAESLSELKHAADLSGTSLDGLEKGVRYMQRVIAEAGDGTSTYVDALARVGLKYEDLANLSPEEQFNKMLEGLAQIPDATMRSAAAQELFGSRIGTSLLPMLANGVDGLRNMRQEAHDLGVVYSKDAADKAAELKDEIDRLFKSFKAITRQVAQALVPALLEMIPKIKKVALQIAKFVGDNNELILKLAAVGALLAVGGPVLMGASQLITILGLLGTSAGVVITSVGGIVAGCMALYETFQKLGSGASPNYA